jgi:hypothetical protein
MDLAERARKLGLKGIRARLSGLLVGVTVTSLVIGSAPEQIGIPLALLALVPFVIGILYYAILYQLWKAAN